MTKSSYNTLDSTEGGNVIDILKDPSVVEAAEINSTYEDLEINENFENGVDENDLNQTGSGNTNTKLANQKVLIETTNKINTPKPNIVAGERNDFTPKSHLSVDKRAEYLYEREQKIIEREKNLEYRERELEEMSDGALLTPQNNWPNKWYAIDYHNIDKDIPLQHQRLCKRAYHMQILTVFALCQNMVAQILLMVLTGGGLNNDYLVRVLMATIYAILGIVLSQTGWYKGLYIALKQSSSLVQVKFQLMFVLHILFVAYSIIGMPDQATSGVFNLLKQLESKGSWVVFSFCIVSIAVQSVIAILTLVIFRSARIAFKSKGGDRKVRSDMRSAVINELSLSV